MLMEKTILNECLHNNHLKAEIGLLMYLYVDKATNNSIDLFLCISLPYQNEKNTFTLIYQLTHVIRFRTYTLFAASLGTLQNYIYINIMEYKSISEMRRKRMSIELAQWFYRRINRSISDGRDQAAFVSVEVRSQVYPLHYGSPRYFTMNIQYINIVESNFRYDHYHRTTSLYNLCAVHYLVLRSHSNVNIHIRAQFSLT